jgi:hypothetical protein
LAKEGLRHTQHNAEGGRRQQCDRHHK